MAQSIFTSETPAVTDANDTTRYTLATLFTPAVNGTITHGRWFFPVTQPSRAPVFALFARTDDSAGTRLTTATFSLAGYAPGWRTVALAAPTAVAAGAFYYAAVKTEDRYVATNAFFGSALVNGQLTAPANNEALPRRNGRFNDFGNIDDPDYPDSPVPGGGACYFADVVFAPSDVVVRDLVLVVGAPGTKWSTGRAGTKWAADRPGQKWTNSRAEV